MTLSILKQLTDEDSHSPEIAFLLSVYGAIGREVFGGAELVVRRPGDSAPGVASGDYVLLIGTENVWLTSETLRRMKAAVDGGAGLAVPHAVADYSLDGLEPLYTPRDYEWVEQRLLAGAPRRADRPASLFPISLMSGAAFHRLASAAFPAGLTVARAGLFHPFVDYYGEARADLLPFLPARAAHVLEIGCGRGRTGALIQDRLGCRVTGVEQNPLVAGDASGRLWRVIVGDVRSADLDGQYDAIVASELVEHLDEPEPFFTRMRSLLAPGGRIVLSVPNVGHYSVVEDLISGRWDYVPAGLLCYTHLRFFTRRTVEDWMHRFGFDCAIVPQVTELPARFAKLPPVFAADMDSLRAKGFYVVLTEPAAQRTASTSDGRR